MESVSKSWRTKEDVLQDFGAIGEDRINDCLVIGDRPPPPLREEIDGDEFNIRFGDTTCGHIEVQPDLHGITQYLRMLSDDEDDDELEMLKNGSGDIVISKLNPLVKEFVPNTKKIDSPTRCKLHPPKLSETSHEADTHTTHANGLEHSAISSQTNDDIAEKTNILRNKISETLKSDSPIHKRKRNVAIANLLLLHSVKPSPSTSTSNDPSTEEKVKLVTPEYFIKTHKTEEDETIEPPGALNIDPCIQESINKVNNWFEKPASPSIPAKTTSVSMAPLSFKRKDIVSKSPTEDNKVKSEVVAEFKPSKYANDLAKKYTKRSQENEQRGRSIWDNLEIELKIKDEAIRKKLAANRKQPADSP